MLTRLTQLATPVINGSTYTYSFGAISQGYAASVSVSVPSSPVATVWTISVSGTVIATSQGANTTGPIYLGSGDVLSVTGQPGGTFSGAAVMIGVQGPPSDVPPSAPSSSSNSVSIGDEINVTGDVTATISGTADVNVTNASIPVAGSVDANITNASIAVTGSVDVATASGATVDVSGSSVAISSGSVDANITNASLSVTGTVDIGNTASVTVASGTVDIGNTPTVDIAAGQVVQVENTSGGSITVAGSVDISNTPAVTVSSGTVDIGNTPAVTISGTPTIDIAAGQVVQVENTSGGSITVAGTIDANITNATLDISGTVDLAAGQVVQVENTSGGSITVAGSVDIGNTPSVSIGNAPSVDPTFSTALTTALSTGGAVTSIDVTATTTPVLTGQSLTLASGSNIQTLTVAQPAPAGATTITVDSFIPNFAYPIGTAVLGALNIAVTNDISIAAGQVVEVQNTSGGSLTVAGTVNIGNSPAVTISGTPTVSISGTPTVTVGSGSVEISNTPSVTLSGSANQVQIANTPSVTVSSGTVDATVTNATIESGTVDISAMGTGTTLLATVVGTGTVQTQQVTPPKGTGALTVLNIPNGGGITITWDATGLKIPSYSEYSPSASTVPIYGNLPIADGSYTYTISAIVDSGTSWYIIASTTIDVVQAGNLPLYAADDGNLAVGVTSLDSGTIANVVDVASPAAGANWSYTLPYPARVAHIGATYTCDSTTGNRYPYVGLSTGPGGSADALPAGTPLGANQAANLSWVAGPLAVPFFSPGANVWRATLSQDVVFSTGQVIAAAVGTYQGPGDTWTNINLTLVPA